MIGTEHRQLLSEALTPPAGCSFDSGVATTFTLDLTTMLSLPMHLSWLATTQDEPETVDPLRMLEALRRTAARLVIYCDRGRMQIPRMQTPLIGFLEDMIHERIAPHGGAFHPKVWLLRFTETDEPDNVTLRLLVMTRNLTDDRSWDLKVQLEGQPLGKRLRANKPLVDFFEALAGSGEKPLGTERQIWMDQLVAEAHGCDWQLPPGFDKYTFSALGLGRKPVTWLPTTADGDWDELGVISPFVTGGALTALAEIAGKPIFLISRAEELDSLGDPLPGGFANVKILDDRASTGDDDDDRPGSLSGLHAKAYIGKRGWNTHLFLGSANASAAALIHGHNVEFMVELVGKSSRVGLPSSWIEKDGLGPLLLDYERSEQSTDTSEKLIEERLDEIRCQIVAQKLAIGCRQTGDDWELLLQGLILHQMEGVVLAIWPLTLKAEHAVKPDMQELAGPFRIGVVPKSQITSLTGFSLSLQGMELQFGLDIPLLNPPEGRDLEILKALMRNRDDFIRYLSMLLGILNPVAGIDEGDGPKGGAYAWASSAAASAPLFELMVKAYAREPDTLQHVSRLVRELTQGDSASQVVPQDFLKTWNVFETALAAGHKP